MYSTVAFLLYPQKIVAHSIIQESHALDECLQLITFRVNLTEDGCHSYLKKVAHWRCGSYCLVILKLQIEAQAVSGRAADVKLPLFYVSLLTVATPAEGSSWKENNNFGCYFLPI